MPRLFVEAKGVGKNLDDKQFIAQAVNYANNEGVIWCVLTNGLVYRVYKANEPVPMQEKLLFEVDLAADEAATSGEIARSLELISHHSIADDQLDEWGERVTCSPRLLTPQAAWFRRPCASWASSQVCLTSSGVR